MRVKFLEKVFVCECKYSERETPKAAGFRWHPGDKRWYTPTYTVAARLREHFDESARIELHRKLLTVTPWSGDVPFPPTETPLQFQLDAVRFALERNRSYLALDPGLGKTICAAIISNALKLPAVYICPPFLLKNVDAEMKRWCTGKMPIVFPDTQLENFHSTTNKLLFVDEAHRFKNDASQRTKFLFNKILPLFDKVVFLSGTPMPNRPIELFPVLSHAAPETIDNMSKFEFGRKYCAGYKGKWGWDFSGASNVKELAAQVMGKFMLRLKKEDVLKELPPKTHEMVFLSGDLPPSVTEFDKKILGENSGEDVMKAALGEDHIASYRRELGLAKVPHAVEYLDFILESTDESVLVFAIHKDVIHQMAHALRKYTPFIITGEVKTDYRQDIANAFQNGKSRVLLLNIQAGGIGFNLTRANRVVFVEFSWVPGENDQASDRAHRIGQKDNVLCQYLVYRDSIDAKVLESNFRKRKTINQME